MFCLCSRLSTVKAGDSANRSKEKAIDVQSQPADVAGEETTIDSMSRKRKRNIESGVSHISLSFDFDR